MTLDFLVIPTYNAKTLGIADSSLYDTSPPDVESPTMEITIPGFAKIVLPFSTNDFTVYNSTTLGITSLGDDTIPLPDGVYTLKYSVTPAYLTYKEKTIIRTERLQEKFDEAFMSLDMMECDKAIRKQSFSELTSVWFFIQGAIAAANNCAQEEATRLYLQADKMLNNFLSNTCSSSTLTYNTYGM